MILKIYLQPARDIELIALLFNPAINFSGVAKQALHAFVRGEKYSFEIPKTENYVSRSLVCYVNLSENDDAEIINYMEEVVISKSAFVRNVISHALCGDFQSIYKDEFLKDMIDQLSKQQNKRRKQIELEKRLRRIKEDDKIKL